MTNAWRLVWLSTALILQGCAKASVLFSSRLIHRFSDEMKLSSGVTEVNSWPVRGSLEYYQRLFVRDFHRQKMKLGRPHQLVSPSEGSQTKSFGNDFGWLHYTWIDIGTPNISFLVAVDDGSDLLWVPCNCIQCFPLSTYSSNVDDAYFFPQNKCYGRCSLVYGAFIMQGRDLNEYDPASSSTSRDLPCGQELCDSDSNCDSSVQTCPYTVNYLSANTSSSGMLFQDVLHLSSTNHSASNKSLQASIVLGCGRMQSGGYMDGVAPDGVLGLGLGDISVPSFLARSGLVRDSFSLCFNYDGSGTIFFGDQGPTSQKMTPFLKMDGRYKTYTVGVDACCVGNNCLKQTSFTALIDSGTSFTYLSSDVYDTIVQEFDSQVNDTRETFDGFNWEYCYKSSGEDQFNFPSIRFMLAPNNSFVIHYPVLPVNGDQGTIGYCLTVMRGEEYAIIGQDFMTGYRIVFDRENMKLGWSNSSCLNVNDEVAPTNGGSPNQLPSNEEQSSPRGHAVAPAIAGKAPSHSSATSPAQYVLFWLSSFSILTVLMHLSLLELDCHIQ